MKSVNCFNCNKKLGEIDENELSATFEKGVEPSEPSVSNWIISLPFTCPNCGLTKTEVMSCKPENGGKSMNCERGE